VEVAVVGSLTIVVNPAAGGGRAIRHLPAVRTVLDAAGARYLICQSSSLGHARAIAAEAAVRGDLVVAFGGDGMAGAVASAVAQAKPGGDGVFGVIAAGRGNDLARTYGIPLGPADAARLLLAGESRPMDLVALAGEGGSQVTVAGSVYLGIASAAGQIANDTRLIRGPLVYPVAALRALAGWEPVTFHVDATTSTSTAGTVTAPQEFVGYGVVVANIPYFGAGMKVAPKADPGDGVLDIVLMRHAPKLTFLRVLTKIRKGMHVELDQIDTGRATAVTVTFDRPLRVGADGELFSLLSPLRISVLPKVLFVIAPRVVTDLCTCGPPRLNRHWLRNHRHVVPHATHKMCATHRPWRNDRTARSRPQSRRVSRGAPSGRWLYAMRMHSGGRAVHGEAGTATWLQCGCVRLRSSLIGRRN
jgi:diacylglycerol kinase (ATP)